MSEQTTGTGKVPAHVRSELVCDPKAKSLVEVLRKAAAERPDAVYLNLLDSANKPKELTFRAVLEGAERWARWLVSKKVERGSRIAVLLPTGEDFLFAFFGAQMAGATPVPLAFPLALGNHEPYVLSLSKIVASASPKMFVTVPNLEAPARKLLEGIPGCELFLPTQVGEAPAASFPEVREDDVALVQYASGRVHAPTGAVLTHRQVLSNVFGLGTALKLTADDVALTWVPLVHDMGLIGGLFTSLYWRCPLVVMPPQTFLMHPYLWLKNITQFKVTLAAAPNAGYQLCVKRVQERHLKDLDLSRWRLALNGAETVHPSTVQAFCEKFAGVGFNPKAMFPTYGLAENTLATACPSQDLPYQTEQLEGGIPVASLGGPLAGQELAVVDGSDAVVGERVEGEVVVRGPCVMSGYLGNEDATRHAIDEKGWLHTGDLGFITGGRLCLTGRKKDMVIKMGRNYYPSDVEGLLASFPRLAGGKTLAFAAANLVEGTEDLILLVESDPLDEAARKSLTTELNAEMLGKIGIRADKVVTVAKGALGSLDRAGRAELRRRYLEGQLP
ncbi:MAG TPA: AMP-binding protein [Myxococcales bacterium]|jgi:acyl-CoA synthetase (AMP-forming)/AMP-acid ligase II